MFKKEKKIKKDRFKSKYTELDFDNMSEEEFSEISGRVYRAIAIRGVGGMLLFIVCIFALIFCSKYLW